MRPVCLRLRYPSEPHAGEIKLVEEHSSCPKKLRMTKSSHSRLPCLDGSYASPEFSYATRACVRVRESFKGIHGSKNVKRSSHVSFVGFVVLGVAVPLSASCFRQATSGLRYWLLWTRLLSPMATRKLRYNHRTDRAAACATVGNS